MSVQSDTAALACFSVGAARGSDAALRALDIADAVQWAAQHSDARLMGMVGAIEAGDHAEAGRLLANLMREYDS